MVPVRLYSERNRAMQDLTMLVKALHFSQMKSRVATNVGRFLFECFTQRLPVYDSYSPLLATLIPGWVVHLVLCIDML